MNEPASTSDTHSEFAAKVAQLKNLADECCSSAPGMAKEAISQARETATKATHQALETVRKHPVEVAAIAIGAGLLVWWLVSRR